jgi:hypothetical protein
VPCRAAPDEALAAACASVGLDGDGTQLLYSRANAVCKLAGRPIVARLRYAPGSAMWMDRLPVPVRATAWLNTAGFPAVRPLNADQPAAAGGYIVTFWHYLEATGPSWEDVTSLARLLRRLPQLSPSRRCAFPWPARSARCPKTPNDANGSSPPSDPGSSRATRNSSTSTPAPPGPLAAG